MTLILICAVRYRKSAYRNSLATITNDRHFAISFTQWLDRTRTSRPSKSFTTSSHKLPERPLANIPVTAENFSRAWEALTSRYENRRILVTIYFDRIFDLKPLTQKSSSELKTLLSTIKESLGALESLGARIEHWDIFVVYFVARRLDAKTLEVWELKQGNSTELASFAQLELFLEGRIRALESVQSRAIAIKFSPAQKSTGKSKPAVRAHAAVVNNPGCSYCNASHYIASCSEFATKPIERHDFVTRKNLCFNCLGSHRLSECRTIKPCRRCKGQHHTLFHRDSANVSLENATSSSTSGTSTVSPVLSHLAATHHECTHVLLATACVTLVTDQGRTVKIRASLDHDSEVLLIQESLMQLLRIPRGHVAVPIMSIGAHNAGSSTRGVVALRLRSCLDSSFEFDVSAFILPKITGRIPSKPMLVTTWNHLVGLPLADPKFAAPGPIDMILGADMYGSLLLGAIKRRPSNTPVAQQTVLGWIISGPVTSKDSTPRLSSFVACSASNHEELQNKLQRFWLQEEVPSPTDQRLSPEESECENHFIQTHFRDETGRYIVRLPFRSNHKHLGESRSSTACLFQQARQRIQ